MIPAFMGWKTLEKYTDPGLYDPLSDVRLHEYIRHNINFEKIGF